MLDGILAFGLPGGMELIIVAIMVVIFCILPLVLLFFFIVSLGKTKAENQRLRVEMDRLKNGG